MYSVEQLIDIIDKANTTPLQNVPVRSNTKKMQALREEFGFLNVPKQQDDLEEKSEE